MREQQTILSPPMMLKAAPASAPPSVAARRQPKHELDLAEVRRAFAALLAGGRAAGARMVLS